MSHPMRFSESTLTILKNFSSLNTLMYFKKGNVIRTINGDKTILAEATIDESLPTEFALYDLVNFLAVLSLDDESDLVIDPAQIHIISPDKKTTLVYRCCDLKLAKNPFERNLTLPTQDCVTTLSEKDIQWALKAGSVLQSPQIAVVGDGTALTLQVLDAANDAASSGTRQIGVHDGPAFKALFRAEYWKMIPGDYTLTVSLKGMGHFQHTTKKLQYWMSLESGSKRSKTA